MSVVTILGPLGIPMGVRGLNAPVVPNVVTKGGLLKGKGKRKQWYTLPNGMRVETTEDSYRTLLARLKAEPKSVDETAPEAQEIAPAAVVAETVVAEPTVETVIPVARGPLLGQVPEPPHITGAPPVDAALLASVAAAQALREANEAEEQQQARERFEAERIETQRRQDEADRIMAEINAHDEEMILEMLLEDLAA